MLDHAWTESVACRVSLQKVADLRQQFPDYWLFVIVHKGFAIVTELDLNESLLNVGNKGVSSRKLCVF
jgi:hypothetical protein